MCLNFLKPSTDAQANALDEQKAVSQAAADQASQLQQAQQATIQQDQKTINRDFTQFDPAYYKGYRQAYTGYYKPQVADQYSQAQDQLTAALAANGTLESSVGNQALANLAKANTDQTAQIQQQADGAVTQLRQNVSGDKTALYNQADAAVDPTQIAGTATADTTALAAPPAYTPLGSVFANFVTPFSNYTKSATTAPVSGAIPGMVIPQQTTPNGYNSGSTGAYS